MAPGMAAVSLVVFDWRWNSGRNAKHPASVFWQTFPEKKKNEYTKSIL